LCSPSCQARRYRTRRSSPAAAARSIIASTAALISVEFGGGRRRRSEKTKSLGHNIITIRELFTRGFADVLAELQEKLKGRPAYLCFDMDVFDPSCAPGVATPSWGGLSAREGIEFLQGLSGLEIVAVDVNTVSPPHDIQKMTASLAARVIYERLVLLCQKPS